ncbi:hypothetical protein THAOC_26857, partial [Thalassiosira oceanica]
AVGGNSGHSVLLWSIEEHVKKIEAIHGNSGGVDADAVVHIFPGIPRPDYLRLRISTAAAPCLACLAVTVALCTGVVDFCTMRIPTAKKSTSSELKHWSSQANNPSRLRCLQA